MGQEGVRVTLNTSEKLEVLLTQDINLGQDLFCNVSHYLLQLFRYLCEVI